MVKGLKMVSAKDWLVGMLGKRGLQSPDGRMLFKYRLVKEEYLAARDVLRQLWQTSTSASEFLGSRATCGLFVLYASEWWRREYVGGPWRWTPIVQSFALPNETLSTQDRTEALIRGIHHWRHLPGSEGKKYFGVLVAHGGLPLCLIAQGGSKVRAVLSSALKLALRYRWDQAGIEQAITERAIELSQPLRHREIYALMARIVVVILELRNDFSLAGVTNPTAVLDAKEPHWRDRFPLSLDETATHQLLTGLVDEAAQQNTLVTANSFRVERRLREISDGSFEISSSVRHPTEMQSDVFASVLGMDAEAIPRYFTVDVQLEDRQPLCDGRQVLGSVIATVNLAPRHPQWKGPESCKEHLLHVCSPAGELTDGALSIPGGNAVSLDDPWIFTQRDEQFVLVSTGSVRLPEPDALIVCTARWHIELSGPGAKVKPLGKCTGFENDLHVFEVRGDVRIVGDGTTFRLRTGQATQAPDQLAWEGRRLTFQTSSLPVFTGMPSLNRYSAEGTRTRILPAQLKWFVGGRPDCEVVDPARASGPMDVWLMDGEERQVRFRLAILDSAARVSFKSGKSEREGAVDFVGWGAAQLSVDSEVIDWSCTSTASGKQLQLLVAQQPPQTFVALAKWPGSPLEARFTMPFPATGGRFFGADGEALVQDAVLPLHAMQGARFRVFDHNPQTPKRYKVRLTLNSSPGIGDAVRLESEHEVFLDRDGKGEVRLIDLQDPVQRLMGFSDELDASICASLHVGLAQLCRIHIHRYAAAMECSPKEARLSEDVLARLDLETLARIELCAHAFTFAGDQPFIVKQSVSDGTPTGVWKTGDLDAKRAPWLLVPTAGSSLQFRPALWLPAPATEEAISMETPRCPLGEAMAVAEADERFVRLTEVIAEMTSDFFHVSWSLLEQNLTALRHLPLASFDSWRAVALSPAASVACALRLTCPDTDLVGLIRQLRDELGLVWELTSMMLWSETARRLRLFYAQTLGEDLCLQVYPGFYKVRAMLLSTELPGLSLPIQLTLLDAGVQPTAEVINGMRKVSMPWKGMADELWSGPDSLIQKLLLRAHSSETSWPNFNLSAQAIEAFSDTASVELGRKAAAHLKEWLWLSDGRADHRRDVANIPVICALWSVAEVPPEWWESRDKALALKRIRGFDPLWFEAAYRQALLVFLAAGINQTIKGPTVTSGLPSGAVRHRVSASGIKVN